MRTHISYNCLTPPAPGSRTAPMGRGRVVGGQGRHNGPVSCTQWFEAISALADGEDPGVDRQLVEAHLAGCEPCRGQLEELERLRRVARIESARPMEDLSGRVVKMTALADRAGRWAGVRVLLVGVAVYIVVMSLDDLFVSDGSGDVVHSTRHLGAFTLAYGVALLVVAVRPARARTVLPVGITLAVALVITGGVDIAESRVPLSGEAFHLPELASVVLLWLLAVPVLHGSRRRVGRVSSSPQASPLRVVRQGAEASPETSTGSGRGSAGARVSGVAALPSSVSLRFRW